jgi:NAD(P)-dependent dehydrogenase (short-subunit alcohol dehydrogenase family)
LIDDISPGRYASSHEEVSAIAQATCRCGAACCIATASRARQFDEIRLSDARIREHQCDLMDSDAAERMVDAAVAELGGVDALANNAGTNRRESIFEVCRQTWDIISTVGTRRASSSVSARHVYGCRMGELSHSRKHALSWFHAHATIEATAGRSAKEALGLTCSSDGTERTRC